MMQLYYWAMMRTYRHVFGAQQMLHYPIFSKAGQTLLDGQRAFSDIVAASAGGIAARDVLDIGCGNGEQGLYLAERHAPRSYRGIDLFPPHIGHATEESRRRGIDALFAVDDAQALATIADGSIDVVLCVETAHHYPDKDRFLAQVHRVLRPGGRFAIAEIVSRSGNNNLAYRLTDTLCWTQDRWQCGIAAAGLALDDVQDVTVPLSDGLALAERGIAPGGNLAARLAKGFGRQVIRHYLRELAGDRRYLVMAGTRPPAAGGEWRH